MTYNITCLVDDMGYDWTLLGSPIGSGRELKANFKNKPTWCLRSAPILCFQRVCEYTIYDYETLLTNMSKFQKRRVVKTTAATNNCIPSVASPFSRIQVFELLGKPMYMHMQPILTHIFLLSYPVDIRGAATYELIHDFV